MSTRPLATWWPIVLPLSAALAWNAACEDKSSPATGPTTTLVGCTSATGGGATGGSPVGGSGTGGVGQGGGTAGGTATSGESVEGTFSHGSVVTVHGAQLGTHPDEHPDDDKLIRMWEPFETGDFTSNPHGSWGLFNPDAVAVIEDAGSSRHAAGDHFLYRRNDAD